MEALFIYLLKSAGILAIFFIAYKLLLQKETFFTLNRHYLIGGIIASLLLPLVVFTSYVYVDPLPIDSYSFTSIPVAFTESVPAEETVPFNWNALFFNIYVLGVLIIGVQFILQLISLYRIIKSGTIKYYNTFKLVEVSDNVSPFSFFNYIIYNPDNFSEKDLEIILNHEKAHGRQLHSIDILLVQLFVIFQWFNPIVWLYKKTIQQNLEFMADKAAISNLESRQNYQRTLLKVSVAPYCTSITNNFYNSLIKKRIVMLNQKSSKTRNLWKYIVVLPLLGLFLVSFNTETIEILKEDTPKDNFVHDNSFEYFNQFSAVNTSDEKVTPIEAPNKVNEKSAQVAPQNDVLAKITKNTTKEELDQIEKDMKAKGWEFSYGNVDYNSAGEITSIRIKYKDNDSGSSGSYHVSGDDDEPINTIYIFKTEKGGIGLGNSPDKVKERMEAHKERMIAHDKRMKERKERHEDRMKNHEERIYEHKLKMKEHNAKMKEEHEERMEAHRARIKEHRVQIEKEHEERMEEHDERMEEHKARMKEHREERILRRKGGDSSVVFVFDDNQDYDKSFRLNTKKSNALYVVDGKIADKKFVRSLDADDVKTVDVLKGQSAVLAYGDKAKNGVVRINTKGKVHDGKSYSISRAYSDRDSGGTNVWVSKSGKSKTHRITKNTTDETLNAYKAQLKENGIDAKFSKIKRNKRGEITRIKIALDDNQGNKSSTTYNTGDEGISRISVGKRNGKLVVRSN